MRRGLDFDIRHFVIGLSIIWAITTYINFSNSNNAIELKEAQWKRLIAIAFDTTKECIFGPNGKCT